MKEKRVYLYKCFRCCKKFPTKLTYSLHLERKHIRRESEAPVSNIKEEHVIKFELATEELKIEEISLPELIIKPDYHEWDMVSLNDDILWEEEICDINVDASSNQSTFIKCDFCLKQIPKFLFQNHVPAVHKFRFCCLCNESIFSSKHIHPKLTELNPDYYKCCTCTKTFVSVGSFRSHLITHYYCNYMCTVCENSFRSEEEFKEHLMQHKVTYRCKICRLKYLLIDSFQTHILERHASSEYCKDLLPLMHMLHRKYLKISCAICRNTFQQIKDLTTHVLEAHVAIIETLTNKPNNEISNSEAVSKRHLFQNLTVNPSGKKFAFSCKFCHKKTETKDDLDRHVSVLHKNETKKFSCKFCKKVYFKMYPYRKHMSKHLRWYSCDICGKRFKRKTSCDIHIVGMHKTPEQVECKICNRLFNREAYLHQHISRMHKKSNKK